MSRLFLLMLPIAVTACTAPPAQPTALSAPATFTIPMDPGSISCGVVSNPAALSAAADWTMGQARAELISGTRGTLPDPAQISASLQSYCQANPAASIRAASAQLAI